MSWLENIKLKHPWQQIVLQEYINAVTTASENLNEIHKYLLQAKNAVDIPFLQYAQWLAISIC